MSKLLENHIDTNELTPAFSSQTPKYSKETLESIPCLYIEDLTATLSKKDTILTIDSIQLDLSKMTIKELCSELLQRGIHVSYIEYESILDLPAVLLTDISTIEYHSTPISVSPFPLERLAFFKNSGIIAIDPKVEPVYSFNALTKKMVLSQLLENDRLLIKGGIDENTKMYYSVRTSKLIWKFNINSTVVNSKEFISKYIWANNAN